MQLRPYQLEAIDQLRNLFSHNKRKVVLCLPTGAGKTVVFSSLVKATLQKNEFARVLILTHRQELLTQAGGTLRQFGIPIEPIIAKRKHINPDANVYVGMVETYYRRIKQNPHLLNMNLIIIDEAHYGNFKKLFAQFQNGQYIVGATATPISAVKSDPMSNYYDEVICPVQIPELIDSGFLSPVRTFSVPSNRSELQKDWSGEFSDESQMLLFDKREVYANMLAKYREFGLNEDGTPTRTIVFNVNIAHSLEVTKQFNLAGILARHIDGETPTAERESIIAGFKSGVFPVICNVGILNAGFDDPAVKTIIVNRATASMALWKQMAGRGSRIHPGKEYFTLIDMGENYTDLGLWQQYDDWHSIFRQKKEKKAGIAPVKDCPECGAIFPVQIMDCPTCAYHFEPKEKEPAPDAAFTQVDHLINQTLPDELRELDRPVSWPTLSVQQLHEIQCIRGRKVGWVVNVLRERCDTETDFRTDLTQFGKLKGYKSGWASYQSYGQNGLTA